MIDTRTANDGANGVVVANSIVQALENNNANSLAAAITVGFIGESVALSVLSQEVECRHRHHGSRGQDHANSRRNGQVGATGAQILAPIVNAHQAGAASSIDSLTGSAQIELEGNAVGKDGIASTRRSVLRRPIGITQDDLLVVWTAVSNGTCIILQFQTCGLDLPLTKVPTLTEVSEKSRISFEMPAEKLIVSDGHVTNCKVARDWLTVLQSVVCDLQQNALLRVNGLGLSG